MAGIKITDLPAAPSAQLTDVFPVDQLPGPVTYKESNQQLLSLFQANGAALTKTDDTNVTMTLGGSPSTALLNAASMTLGWTGQLSVPRGGTDTSSFTAFSVICGGTTATGALQSVIGLGTAGEQLTSNGPGALPTWQAGTLVTPSALTTVDDTNMTLTLGGTPSTALLQAVSITAGWAGQLSLARGGTNNNIVPDNGAMVYCDADSFELLAATATAGQIVRSGANSAPSWSTATYPAAAGTSGNVLASDGTNWVSTSSAGIGSPLTTKGDLYTFSTVNARLAVGTTNGQMLQVNSGTATGLAWSTATYPATATNVARILRSDGTNWVETTATFADTYAASGVLYANGANNVAGLATANNGVLVTNGTGVPSISSTLPAFTTSSITFNPTTSGIVGTTTNDNAGAGFVGQVISSAVADTTASLTSTTTANVTSISLTAGDWDVSGYVVFVANAATTIQQLISAISLTSATLPSTINPTIAEPTSRFTAPFTTGNRNVLPISTARISVASTTSVYLVANSTFGVNVMTVGGAIYARRAR